MGFDAGTTEKDGSSTTKKPSDSFLYSFAKGPTDASDISDLAKAKEEISALRKSLSSGGQHQAKWTFFKKQSDTKYTNTAGGVIMSGGNFHGEYPAKALDYLAI